MALRWRDGLATSLAALLALASPAASAVRPRYGGAVVRGGVGEIHTLDPLAATLAVELEAARQVHAGLYRFDAGGEPEPDLVERAEVERDGMSVRLVLRRAWFHGGRPLGAEDARASIERFAAHPGAGRLLLAGTNGGALPLVTVLGERELRLRVAGAPVLWPWLLAGVSAAVLPPAELAGERGTVGAGPFVVTELTPRGDRLVLGPNERHHRGRPLLERLEYRAFPDERALALAHRHQGVDFIDQPGAEETPGETGVVASVDEVVALLVNPARAPFDEAPVRESALAAVRIDALVDVVLGGNAVRATGILKLRPLLGPGRGAALGNGADPGGNPGSSATPGQAGGPPAMGIKRALTLVYPEDQALRATAERLRVDLHAAGYTVAPQGLAAPGLAAAIGQGRFDLALVILPGAELPPVIQLAEVAELVLAELPSPLVAAATEVAPRGEIGSDLFAAESAILDGARLRPLFQRRRRFLSRESLHGVQVGPDRLALFEDAWRLSRP